MSRTELKTKVIMDNGNTYEFMEPIEQFLKKIYDFKTDKIISTLLKGENFYINTEHIASIEEVEDMALEEKKRKWELEQMAIELRKMIDDNLE